MWLIIHAEIKVPMNSCIAYMVFTVDEPYDIQNNVLICFRYLHTHFWTAVP